MIEETIRFLVCAALAGLVLFAAAVLLTGCSELKYAECLARDNTTNPCN